MPAENKIMRHFDL